jgi:transcriptional regulator with XRE-family HTH domain
MNVAERIGANLAECRERMGISQEELGFRAEMHRTAVGQIERGIRIPRADSLVKLAGALGCSPCDLLAGLTWTPHAMVRGGFGQRGGS